MNPGSTTMEKDSCAHEAPSDGIEELHGIFQFSELSIKENFQKKSEKRGPKEYMPHQVYPEWHFESAPKPGYDEFTLAKFRIESLYLCKEYLKCTVLIKEILSKWPRHNIYERELLEIQAHAAVKLQDRESAFSAVELLDKFHRVEEPGLNLVKAEVYFAFGMLERGVEEAEAYLALRPGDIHQHMEIARRTTKALPSTALRHLEAAEACLRSARRSDVEMSNRLLPAVKAAMAGLAAGNQGQPKMKTFVLRFAQIKEDFRKAELESIARIFGITLDFAGQDLIKSPFLVIQLENEEQLQEILSRSVLIMDGYEFFACADRDLAILHDLVKQLNFKEYEWPSFRFRIDSFGKTLDDKTQLDMINSFSYMPLKGPVRLRDAHVTFTILIDWTVEAGPRYMFTRHVGISQRHIIDRFDLKKREYLGTTSMEAELSFVMTNVGCVRDGDLVIDPFVGTGSCLFPGAHFGAYVIGSDIDGRQIRGRHSPLHPSISRSPECSPSNSSLYSNVEQYGLHARVLGGLVGDICQHPWRDGVKFDAIICDPPYGVRAGAKRIAKVKERCVPVELRSVIYPTTAPYELDDLTNDLLHFAASFLMPRGRLVFWYAQDIKGEIFDPAPHFSHPDMTFCYSIPQRQRNLFRWLLVYERK